MRNFTFIFIALVILGSCKTAQVTEIPRNEKVFGIDFTEYSKNGFLFTPEKYDKEYESVAIITIEVLPGAKRESDKIKESDAIWAKPEISYYWKVEDLNLNDVLKLMYDKCIVLGANALINFKAEPISESFLYVKPPVNRNGYRLSGFAIKRK